MNDPKIPVSIERVDAFLRRMTAWLHEPSVPLSITMRSSTDPVSFADRLNGDAVPVQEGDGWGTPWSSAWFHVTGRVPTAWRGKNVAAQLDINGEGLVFDSAGHILQGITDGSIFDRRFGRDIVRLFACSEGGEEVDLWIEGACNHITGIEMDVDLPVGHPNRYGAHQGRIHRARLCVLDADVWQLQQDINVLRGQLDTHSVTSVRHARILRALNRAMDAVADCPSRAAAARAILASELQRRAHDSALTVTAVGHGHIDTGWLWPVRETIRKCARTFASQLDLIERYPGYIFGASQAQHYAFVKTHYPALFERIRQAVREGRWECQGGMWVEADSNLISGESMIRQFLHGKRFFMSEFGVEVCNAWIPDVFGYSASMPQIIRKAGCRYLVTQKMSWNQFNRFPHSTFRWRGIDGSDVIAHFPPEDNYNSDLSPKILHDGAERFRERAFLDGFLSLFGIGDGGGGPHEIHIENGLRQADLEGAPRVRFGSAQSYLDTLEPLSDALPLWDGELYLELHRGTLTTQARTKRGNRLLENRLRQVEYLWSCLPGNAYPAATLDPLWKTLLINQFHDILPGSSIREVYAQTEREHRETLTACDALIDEAGAKLLAPDGDCVTLVNVLSSVYSRPVVLPPAWLGGVLDAGGRSLPVQQEGERVVVSVDVPPLGSVTLRRHGRAEPATVPAEAGLVLENRWIRYTFESDGALRSVFDKEIEREVLAAGMTGNRLVLYADLPNRWDAWDVDYFYEDQLLETARSQRWERLPGGAVRHGLRFEMIVGQSRITQTVHLASGSRRLDFATVVDWREKHRMLRVSFPVSVRAPTFTADIQYGFVERPTHRNTSWDMARFEVAAHRYVDLSDRDYGVALLNDCKYGHKVHENVLDLNLLRSSTYPDPDADQGEQCFTYSLLPHCGSWNASDGIAEAAALNVPVMAFADATGVVDPPCRVEGEGVSLETIKKAEDEKAWILRLVEIRGRRSQCRLHVRSAIDAFQETDMLERPVGELRPTSPEGVVLSLLPFEILTLRVPMP